MRPKTYACIALGTVACLLSEARAQPPVRAMADFRTTIARAKTRVFPAVVFVKPIVEAFDEGKKVSREYAGSGVLISGGIREDDEGANDQFVWDFRNPPSALPKTFRPSSAATRTPTSP